MRPRSALVLLAAVLVAGCSSSSSSAPEPDAGHAPTDDASPAIDAAIPLSEIDASEKASTCASTFGQSIATVGFARFDGTVVAIVPPNDQTCAEPNSTHLVLQIESGGAVYRMVVDVDDTSASGTIRAETITHPMIGGAWQDGWHAVPLDYVTDLAQTGSSFATVSTADAVASIVSALDVGERVSVFATAQGEADSAHLVHRNATSQDGAIVLGGDGPSPTWMLFAFANQSF